MPRPRGSRSTYGERYDFRQFRDWVVAMDYPVRQTDARTEIPYDTKQITRDLGVNLRRVHAYWRGDDGKGPVKLSPTATNLCKALLRIRELEQRLVQAEQEE